MLLDHGEEVLRGFPGREDDSFAAEGPDLGASDREHVAEAGEFLQCDVAFRAHETVSQARAVDEQRQPVFAADRMDLLQLGLRVESPVFGRE